MSSTLASRIRAIFGRGSEDAPADLLVELENSPYLDDQQADDEWQELLAWAQVAGPVRTASELAPLTPGPGPLPPRTSRPAATTDEDREWARSLAAAQTRAKAEEVEWRSLIQTAKERAKAEESEWRALLERAKAKLAAEEAEGRSALRRAKARPPVRRENTRAAGRKVRALG